MADKPIDILIWNDLNFLVLTDPFSHLQSASDVDTVMWTLDNRSVKAINSVNVLLYCCCFFLFTGESLNNPPHELS